MGGKFYIGIDGGGSGTRGALSNASGRLLRQASAGPTNHHNRPLSEVEAALRALLSVLTDADHPLGQVARLCYAGSNIDTGADEAAMRGAFSRLGYRGKLLLCSDGAAQLAQSGCAALIACGTGSIAHGIDRQNRLFRVGGWGHKLGDACCGYSIAIAGLEAVLMASDGRAGPTALTPALLSALGLAEPEQILDFAYGPEGTPERIAALAPVVIRLAESDATAAKILDAQAELLMPTLRALTDRIARPFSLALAGKVLQSPPVLRRFTERAKILHPSLTLRTVSTQPALGALKLAQDPSMLNL